MSQEQLDAFYSLLDVPDVEVAVHHRPDTLVETDVIIVFLLKWSDALSATGAKAFPNIYKEISVSESDVYRQVANVNLSNKRGEKKDLKFVFYGTSYANVGIKCYADDILSLFRKKKSIVKDKYCGENLLD